MQRSTLFVYLLILVLGFLVIYPLFMLLYGSFKGGPPGSAGQFTVEGYTTAYTALETYKALWTTVWLGAIRAVLAVLIAIVLAWVVTRTDTPWRQGLEVLIWLKFFMPGLPTVIAWTFVAGPQGLLNHALKTILPLEKPVFDVYSYGGIIWVSVLGWSALLFILIVPAFRGMDASLEESSRMAGANVVTTLRRVTLPVLAPAILGGLMIVFIRLIESFETELILGYPKGIFVYTTKIWWYIGLTPSNYPMAMSYATVFLAIVAGLIMLYWRLLREKQFVTITGRGFATRPTKLGRWRYATLGFVLLYFGISVLLPLAALVVGSLMKIWGVYMEDPYTLKHWVGTLDDERFLLSLKNTLLLGVLSATLGMVLYSIMSYIVVRTKLSGRKLLDAISWLPYGVPSLVLALGFFWAYFGGMPLLRPLFGSLSLMVLVFLVRGLPLGCRVMNGAMFQLGNELEESSRVLGASWVYTFRRIVAPLLSPAFISAWIILFLIATRDLVAVLFLYLPKSRLLSIVIFEYWMQAGYERATAMSLVLTVLSLLVALLAMYLRRHREMALG